MQPGREPPQPTEVLIERAKTGNPPALDQLIRRFLPEIRAFVRLNAGRVVRLKESCSDLVQTVCKDVLAKLHQFEYRDENSFRSWLFVAVLNKVRMRERHYRAARRDPAREAPPELGEDAKLLVAAYASMCTPSREAAAHEELARIEAAFDQLPPDYREVITLARLAGLSHAEIGARLGRTPVATRTLLHRAVVRLASVLDDMRQGSA